MLRLLRKQVLRDPLSVLRLRWVRCAFPPLCWFPCNMSLGGSSLELNQYVLCRRRPRPRLESFLGRGRRRRRVVVGCCCLRR